MHQEKTQDPQQGDQHSRDKDPGIIAENDCVRSGRDLYTDETVLTDRQDLPLLPVNGDLPASRIGNGGHENALFFRCHGPLDPGIPEGCDCHSLTVQTVIGFPEHFLVIACGVERERAGFSVSLLKFAFVREHEIDRDLLPLRYMTYINKAPARGELPVLLARARGIDKSLSIGCVDVEIQILVPVGGPPR